MKPGGVVNGCNKSQRGQKTDAWDSLEETTIRVGIRRLADLVFQVADRCASRREDTGKARTA